jgi:hypothetical protein
MEVRAALNRRLWEFDSLRRSQIQHGVEDKVGSVAALSRREIRGFDSRLPYHPTVAQS